MHALILIGVKYYPMFQKFLRALSLAGFVLLVLLQADAQTSTKSKFAKGSVYTGIEVGSKGVKMSVIEIGKNAQASGAFNILKDTSFNTDFISFTPASFQSTLNTLTGFFNTAVKEYKIPSKRIFTVVSSGVKGQAEKDNKMDLVNKLIDSFRLRIKEPQRLMEVIDARKEGKLSHLGIVPESRRFNTFLIDIGSGNTKGGFFPYGNTDDFKVFTLNWGTKSAFNVADKNCLEDKTLNNYYRQLYRVLSGAENSEIIYAVNASGAYPLSDNIAVSGGIAWASATLMHPELIENSVIPITYAEYQKFCETLYYNFGVFSANYISRSFRQEQREPIIKELERVHSVFDQKSLMAGAGLLLKIMRQFESSFAGKQFYLVKNGQVGWVSAYVDQSIDKKPEKKDNDD
jgi:hypothetical protein